MHIRGEMTSGKLTLSGFVRSRPESLWWFEVDFWPLSVHFRRGPPTIFRKHMPSGMGTENLGNRCIFAENGPLEGGIEASGTGWGAKGDFRWIFGPIRTFSKGAPTIFRKHMPWGIGTESLGMIGCIFAENGPLEGGIESSFRGTGWGAKGDFIRYSYLYPYIFESRTHTFFESTCPELYAQQSWECRWIFGLHQFFEGGPHHFPKAHALRYGHRKFGDDRMYIRGEWAFRRWHWSKL